MITLYDNQVNFFVVSIKGFTKSIDNIYFLELFGSMTKSESSLNITDISSQDSTWLKFRIDLPDDIDLESQEFEYTLSRNDDNFIISNGILIVNSTQIETTEYSNDKQYKQYSKN